jgi:hypothetical protein
LFQTSQTVGKLVGTHVDDDIAYDTGEGGVLNSIHIAFAFKCLDINLSGDYTLEARALVLQDDHYFVSNKFVRSKCEDGGEADLFKSFDFVLSPGDFGLVESGSFGPGLDFNENPNFEEEPPLHFGFVVEMRPESIPPPPFSFVSRSFLVDDFSFEANPDADDDGLLDHEDNCIDVPNQDQLDADADECGNVCDGDCTQDGFTGAPDFSLSFAQSGNNCNINPALDCSCDFTSDAIVGAPDFAILTSRSGEQTGPSGLVEGGQCP